MIYPYVCTGCGKKFEVTKSVRYIEDKEFCPVCSGEGRRVVAGGICFYGASDWDSAQYDPALGRVIKSNAERRRIAKERGLEEVGTEPVENIHKHFEEKNKQLRDENWNKV